MKARDGRTARAQRIKEQVRRQIIDAYVELLRSGTLFPTASEIAKSARLSRRVVFKHFADLGQLRAAAVERIAEDSHSFLRPPIDDHMPVEQRLRLFVKRQSAMLEAMTPFRRMALVIEHSEPLVAAVMQRVRAAAVKEIERALHPALAGVPPGAKRNLLSALHMICAWPSWETLRSDHGLSPRTAREVITRSALATLSDALSGRRRVRAGETRKKIRVH